MRITTAALAAAIALAIGACARTPAPDANAAATTAPADYYGTLEPFAANAVMPMDE